MLVQVKFVKVGNKIKFRLPFKMYCNYAKSFIPNSGVYEKTDGLFGVWLGKNIDAIFKKSPVIFKKVELGQIYDHCDIPKS